MKKILGIIASPRKLGNSEIMVKEISRNIPENHKIKLLRLTDFNINYCNACYRCLLKDSPCIQEDHLNLIVNEIAESDGLIVAVPTYFLGPNSSLKALLDRGLSFYAQGEKLWNKPSVGIVIAGIKNKEGYTRLALNSFLKSMLADVKAIDTIYAAYPGESILDDANATTAKLLGNALFNENHEKGDACCPHCGGDSFRFFNGHEVQCLLCSNRGSFEFIEGKPVFNIEKDNFELFLSNDSAREHREWLKDMKVQFMHELGRLKKVREKYKGGWNWIKPR